MAVGDEQSPGHVDAAHPPPGVEFLAGHEVVAGGEGAGFGALAAEGADDAHAAEGFGGVGVDGLAGGADIAEEGADSADPCFVGEPDGGDEQQPPYQHFPVDEGEDEERAGELDDGAPGVVDEGEDQFGDSAGVFAEDGGDAAGFDVVDAMKRKTDGVVEDFSAVIGLNAFGDAGGLPAAPDGEDDGGEGDDDHGQADGREEFFGVIGHADARPELGQRAGAEDIVEDELGAIEREQTQAGGDGEGGEGPWRW